MPRLTTCMSVAAWSIATVFAYKPCAFSGPAYPEPVDFSSNSSKLTSAWAKLSAALDTTIEKNENPERFDWSTESFSIGAFSLHDCDAQHKLQYHWTGSLVANSSVGTRKVDENSIYRIASISKLVTSYLVLVELGMASWEQPITNFFPELVNATENIVPGTTTKWREITVGALAGQISGMGRDIAYYVTDFALQDQMSNIDPTLSGFPPLNFSDTQQVPSCAVFTDQTCPESAVFQQATQRSPTIDSWSIPSYSNIGFILLGAILEKVKGKDYAQILKDGILDPLEMNLTSALPPDNRMAGNAVIPGGNATADWWGNELGLEAAAEGVYSTLADLNKLALSILNSTFLTPVETRRWLKPSAHSGNVNLSVGHPWEIYRITQPVTGRTSDVYIKAGNFQKYASILVLSPDHDAGFNILVAGPQSTVGVGLIQDIVAEALLPAFEAQAAAESVNNFAGAYVSTDPKLNSSMTLVADPSTGPGLVISSWISNGTDMTQTIGGIYYISNGNLDARLYPTGTGSDGYASFRAVYGDKSASATGMFSSIETCQSWETIDAILYGQRGIDEFVFEIDGAGRAKSVSPTALRVSLARKT